MILVGKPTAIAVPTVLVTGHQELLGEVGLGPTGAPDGGFHDPHGAEGPAGAAVPLVAHGRDEALGAGVVGGGQGQGGQGGQGERGLGQAGGARLAGVPGIDGGGVGQGDEAARPDAGGAQVQAGADGGVRLEGPAIDQADDILTPALGLEGDRLNGRRAGPGIAHLDLVRVPGLVAAQWGGQHFPAVAGGDPRLQLQENGLVAGRQGQGQFDGTAEKVDPARFVVKEGAAQLIETLVTRQPEFASGEAGFDAQGLQGGGDFRQGVGSVRPGLVGGIGDEGRDRDFRVPLHQRGGLGKLDSRDEGGAQQGGEEKSKFGVHDPDLDLKAISISQISGQGTRARDPAAAQSIIH